MKRFELVEIRDNGEHRCYCPWHDDRAPSFDINLKKNVANCFHPNCFHGTAKQAIKKLLGYLPTKLESAFEWTDRKPERKAAYWDSGYPEIKLDYMKERGFYPSTIDAWGIYYDENRRCVAIPARRRNGEVAGIIYRQTIPNIFPKYIYSGGFRVSRDLFGAHMFEPFPAEETFVVEGPLDCIWMWQCGFKNTVALLGSNLSETQGRLLRKLSERVILCLDSDSAGKEAMKKIGSQLYMKGYDVHTIRLLEGKKDVQEHSAEELQNIMRMRVPYLEMVLKNKKEKGEQETWQS